MHTTTIDKTRAQIVSLFIQLNRTEPNQSKSNCYFYATNTLTHSIKMCSPTIIMNNNDIVVSCKSLHRVRRRSPTTVVQESATQQFDEAMARSTADYVEFQSKINSIDANQQNEEPKLVERRAALRNGDARRPRPDAKGRINGKECHAFVFAALLEEEIADDL